MKTPEFIMRFATACCPSSPELFLSTGEQNMLNTASKNIEELRAENERLRKALETLSAECSKWGDDKMPCYKIAQEAEKALAGGEK